MNRINTDTDVDRAMLPFNPPTVKVQNTKEAFEQEHLKRPFIYDELKKLSMQLLLAGRRKYSINGLFEVLRWHRALEKPDDDFKLNNIFRSWYARKLMLEVKELRGFFNFRNAAADDAY